jgi:hypothetical protein
MPLRTTLHPHPTHPPTPPGTEAASDARKRKGTARARNWRHAGVLRFASPESSDDRHPGIRIRAIFCYRIPHRQLSHRGEGSGLRDCGGLKEQARHQTCWHRAHAAMVAPRSANAKKLGVLGLASIVFYSVAGTPAGAEYVVVGGGPMLTIIGFLLMPLVWSIPEALVSVRTRTYPRAIAA